jgi:hypothetical protein
MVTRPAAVAGSATPALPAISTAPKADFHGPGIANMARPLEVGVTVVFHRFCRFGNRLACRARCRGDARDPCCAPKLVFDDEVCQDYPVRTPLHFAVTHSCMPQRSDLDGSEC